jgi:hypothetical protein
MGSEERGKNRLGPHAKWAIVVTGLVVSALLYGLFMAGSPQRARQMQFDSRRVEDLRQVSNAVSAHYNETGRLPVGLGELGWTDDDRLADPATGELYEYEAVSDTGYRLCAEFSYSSAEAEAAGERYYYGRIAPVKSDGSYIDGQYESGRHCWDLKVKESGCRLLTDPGTGVVDCFGCAMGTCKTAPKGWEPYVRSPEMMGIPYACFESETGCALAQ